MFVCVAVAVGFAVATRVECFTVVVRVLLVVAAVSLAAGAAVVASEVDVVSGVVVVVAGVGSSGVVVEGDVGTGCAC